MERVSPFQCNICFEPMGADLDNPPMFESVNFHSFHKKCWEGWVEKKGIFLREGNIFQKAIRWLSKGYFYNTSKDYWISCPICISGIKSSTLSVNTRMCQMVEEKQEFGDLNESIVPRGAKKIPAIPKPDYYLPVLMDLFSEESMNPLNEEDLFSRINRVVLFALFIVFVEL